MTETVAASRVDLSVDLAGIALANPIMTASGTSGYGEEYAPYLDLRRLGAFVTKSITPRERKGNEPPRTCETGAGMLNAIGLANVGVDRFVTEKVPYLAQMGIPVIVNVAGSTPDDYLAVCRRLDAVECIRALELNVSCPNVADGLEFGTDARRLYDLVRAVRAELHQSRLIVKLSPNVTDITELASAAIDGGAEILSLVNTFQAMAINVETQRPVLANVTGGLSGPAIKPIALHMVHRVYTAVARESGIPVIGMGGIQCWQDAVEFLLAGATAVAVGTALFVDPTTPEQVLDGLKHYLIRKNTPSVKKLIGSLKT